jgi:type I restriction enzyme S subunit
MKTGWQTANLGDVFVTQTGSTPPTSQPVLFGGFIPFVKPPELRDGILDSAADGLSEAGAAVARTLPPRSILVSCIGNLGKTAINSVPVAFNQQINAVLPNESVAVPEFMFYQVLSRRFKDQLESRASGTTIPIVNKSRFNSIEIVLAPVAEQKRIVRVLDEAFEGIAVAKANAERNLQNARALLHSRQWHLLTRRDATWQEKPLSSLCSLFVDSAHRTPKYQEQGIPALRPRDVVNGELSLETAARVSAEEYEIQSKRHRPRGGDIVYSRELSLGWAVMLPDEPKVCLSQGMCLFRPAPELDADYLLTVLNGPIGREQAMAAAVGAAHPHINLGDIKAYNIPLPRLSMQRSIMQDLRGFKDHTERLATIYQREFAVLDELKKSLLHHAFTGRL